MIFTMFEYLIIFYRILIYMWIKRYVMEILWQQLPDLSIYGGPEMTYSNAVNFSNFLTDQKNQSYLHFFKFI